MSKMNVKTVTVLGANGTMGSNVAGIWASFGDAKVYMVSRTKEKSEKAIDRAAASVRADVIRQNMYAKDYSDMAECIRKSDVVFESIAEDEELKKNLLKQISGYISEKTLICSGTSGLSIDEMAEMLPGEYRKNYIGMHFFNPPYNMTLCELIGSKYVSKKKMEEVKEYLETRLFRTVVMVKDHPAFMGNRIGFHLINLAVQYAEVYKDRGGIDYIDAIMGAFTGRNMPPIRTADFVGLDVHKAIVDNIYENTEDYARETFRLPQYVNDLINKGCLGQKTGQGLYKTVRSEEGRKTYLVYDINTKEYREIRKYDMEFAASMIKDFSEGLYKNAMDKLLDDISEEAMICKSFMAEYVIYSLHINNEVGYTMHDADDAMATGFSWIPPLALIESFGGKETFETIIRQVMSNEEIEKAAAFDLLSQSLESKYDHKRFFKAKR